jgi:protein-S-isoprenylcysteine O-methyltransferase Ste14
MQPHQIIIISTFTLMAFQMIGFGVYLKVKKISMGGLPPITKVLFQLTKAAMMLTWVGLFVQVTGRMDLSFFPQSSFLMITSVVLFVAGSALQFISYIYLGKNLKFGIPDAKEKASATLKKNGIYRFSRNPMYLGFGLMMLGSSLYTLNPFIWILTLFALGVHHLIVLKEEAYLKKRFGLQWDQYAYTVRRYI